MEATLHLAWERFNLAASIMGEVQSRVIALAFYFTIFMPFGIISRLSGDPLQLRKPAQDGSRWLEREPVSEDLDSARQQG